MLLLTDCDTNNYITKKKLSLMEKASFQFNFAHEFMEFAQRFNHFRMLKVLMQHKTKVVHRHDQANSVYYGIRTI